MQYEVKFAKINGYWRATNSYRALRFCGAVFAHYFEIPSKAKNGVLVISSHKRRDYYKVVVQRLHCPVYSPHVTVKLASGRDGRPTYLWGVRAAFGTLLKTQGFKDTVYVGFEYEK